MNGNTPPYKKDPATVNCNIPFRLTTASHHQAAGRERGVRAFNTGFAHVTQTADICWAVSKVLGADAWIMALKPRLGLPQRILDTLPDEEDIVGQAFGFEKAHPELFGGELAGQLGVYFSEETRDHTLYGIVNTGYSEDFQNTLIDLFRNGLCPHTVFAFPETPEQYPVILIPSAVRMTDGEQAAMEGYLTAGGKVIVTGPTPISGCNHKWKLPNRYEGDPMQLFPSCPDGIKPVLPKWFSEPLPDSGDADCWQKLCEGFFYNPSRLPGDLAQQCRGYAKPLPVEILAAKGYLCTVFESDKNLVVHVLAEDYNTDIDHELDAMRYHRSRVNFINKVTPIGIDLSLKLRTEKLPRVYTPFSNEETLVTSEDGCCTVTLPEDCAYAILEFEK